MVGIRTLAPWPAARLFAAALAFVLAAFAPAPTAAQEAYPARTITVYYPYAFSSAWDPMYRSIFAAMSERLGRSVVFESHAGASGGIALQGLAHAKPDGYTLVLTNFAPVTLLPFVSRELGYDPTRDFAPVTLIGYGDSFLLAGPALKEQDLAAVIAAAKRAPESISFAVLGTAQKLQLARIESATGAKFLQVMYGGTAQVEVALLGGHVQLTANSGDPHVLEKGGQIRLLATTAAVRNPRVPAVPTLAEQIPGFESRTWHGFLAPAGTPPERVDLLNRTIQAVTQIPKIRGMMVDNGLDPAPEGPAGFAEVIRAEARTNAELVKKYNISN
jgi:tripartite-type tricarboxylate transporter receptor subunit TctC